VTITGSQSGWARIALNTARGYSAVGTASQPFGWIPADRLTVDARVDGPITVYDWPGLSGAAVATIEGDDMKVSRARLPRQLATGDQRAHGNVWIDQVVRPRGRLPRVAQEFEGRRVTIWGFGTRCGTAH